MKTLEDISFEILNELTQTEIDLDKHPGPNALPGESGTIHSTSMHDKNGSEKRDEFLYEFVSKIKAIRNMLNTIYENPKYYGFDAVPREEAEKLLYWFINCIAKAPTLSETINLLAGQDQDGLLNVHQ